MTHWGQGGKVRTLFAATKALVWALTALSAPVQAEKDELAVMIQTAGEAGNVTGYGAGLIVGYNEDNVYIATANHVIRRQFGRPVAQANVEVPTRPAEYLPARVLSKYAPQLDVGVLAIPRNQFREFDPGSVEFMRLNDTRDLEGTGVSIIGNPNGRSWSRLSEGVEIKAAKTVELRLKINGVPAGYSGGPVIDADKGVVGLLKGESESAALAIRIQAVIESLTEWGIPVALESRGKSEREVTQTFHVQQEAPIKSSTGLLSSTIGRLDVGDVIECTLLLQKPEWCAVKLQSGRLGYVELEALDQAE